MGKVRRFEEIALLIEAAGDADGGRRRCRVRVLSAPYGRGAARARGPLQPTFLDFGQPYPNEVFSAVIWGGAPERAKYPEPPEVFYIRRNLCVTGRIELYGDKPQIVVRQPAQITIDDR